MAHQTPVPQQTQYPGPTPQQHQNTGQQRYVFSEQQNFGQNMPEGTQNPISDTIQGPLLVSFILEKPRNATSWEDVVPEQQHVTVHDLKKEVHKFRRNHNSVKKALNEISSPNCRRIINELVEEQNVALSKLNPAMEYRIVSVVNKFRERNSLTRRERHLVRVDIILEAEDSGFQATKMRVEMSSNEQDSNRARQGNGQQPVQSHINNPNKNMSTQQQIPQQRPQHQVPHSIGTPMHPELPRAQPPSNQSNGHMPMNNQHLPPPPPPPHTNGGMKGQTPMAGPPPPPPPPTGGSHPVMPGPHMQRPSTQHRSTQGVSRMPGSYPEAMPIPIPRPVQGVGVGPVNGTTDPELLRGLRAKYKNRTYTSSLSSESDISWEDESGSSSFVDIESISHEEASGRENERGRHAKRSKKISRHRVHSRSRRQSRSRSRSRSHPHRVVHEQHAQRSERRHRTNSNVDDGHKIRRSPATSASSSPQPLHAKLSSQVPANIHIHMNTPNTGDDRTRSGNASPIGQSHEKNKKPAKVYTSHDSASEASWSRASGTDSWNTASVHTVEDGTWDAPLRNHSTRREHKPAPHHYRRQTHTGTRSVPRYQRDASAEPLPLRSSMRNNHRSRERSRERYFTTTQPAYTSRPDLPHRRTTTATTSIPHNTTTSQPFAPPKLSPRAFSFTPSPAHPAQVSPVLHETYPQQQRRTQRDEQINLRDLQHALEWAREKRKEESEREGGGGRRVRYVDGGGSGGRRRRRDSGVYDEEEDEWAFGFDERRRGRRGMTGYAGY